MDERISLHLRGGKVDAVLGLGLGYVNVTGGVCGSHSKGRLQIICKTTGDAEDHLRRRARAGLSGPRDRRRAAKKIALGSRLLGNVLAIRAFRRIIFSCEDGYTRTVGRRLIELLASLTVPLRD